MNAEPHAARRAGRAVNEPSMKRLILRLAAAMLAVAAPPVLVYAAATAAGLGAPPAALLTAAALCAEIFEVYDPLAARKKIAFSVRAPEKLEFQGDARLLDRVLANLVGNALKFTPAGGRSLT